MSDLLLLVVISVPLILGGILAIADAVVRRDLAVVKKMVWVVALLVFPAIALAVYAITRPRRADALRTSAEADPSEKAIALVALAEGYQRGEIDSSTYDDQVARFRPAASR